MTRRAVIAALALVATPALAQSTVVIPQPGANSYAVIPQRQGFTIQVLPIAGDGWMVVSPAGHSTTVLPLPGDGASTSPPSSP